MHIILIGFMGAGKSKSSYVVSELLGLPRVSTDEEIVLRTRYESIAELFAVEGEASFREHETLVLQELLKGPDAVIDTGGGIVESAENRSILQSTKDPVFFLDATFDVILERVGGDERRPLMLDIHEAKKRYQRRIPWYKACADVLIDASTGTPESRASEVVTVFQERFV